MLDSVPREPLVFPQRVKAPRRYWHSGHSHGGDDVHGQARQTETRRARGRYGTATGKGIQKRPIFLLCKTGLVIHNLCTNISPADIIEKLIARIVNVAEESSEQEATIIVDDVSYPVSMLSESTRELLALHAEATQEMLNARRAAAIREISVKSLATMISASVKEGEQTDADPDANAA